MSADQHRSRWTTSAAVTTVVIGLLASACGIPVSGQVEAIAPEGHEELLNGTTSTTEPIPEPEDTDVIGLQLYFIGPDDLLERVRRPFAEPAIIDDLLVALEQGPTTEEAALFTSWAFWSHGYRTVWPPVPAARTTTYKSSRLTSTLQESFASGYKTTRPPLDSSSLSWSVPFSDFRSRSAASRSSTAERAPCS